MKREFLQNFKIGDQALPKEVIDAILDENSRDIGTEKSKFADYDTVKTQLGEANKAIEGFKALDVDGVKAAVDQWKEKYEQAERDHANSLSRMTQLHRPSACTIFNSSMPFTNGILISVNTMSTRLLRRSSMASSPF